MGSGLYRGRRCSARADQSTGAAGGVGWPNGVGALFGAPIGGALASIGRKGRQPLEWDENPLPGMGTTPKDLAANYWRDKGHPPFMKPSEAEPDKHMFDPDRLG